MMHNEEIERKMIFIAEQHAQFSADMQRLEESQVRTEQIVARTAQKVDQTTEAVARTGRNQE